MDDTDDTSFLQTVTFDPNSVDPGDIVGGSGVSTDASGMSTVTVSASEGGSLLPWILGIGVALFLLSRRHHA